MVPGRFIPHERDALSLVRVGDDAAWFAWLEGDVRERLQQRCNIVAVHLSDRPAEGTPFVCERLEVHRLLGPVALLQAVTVNDHGQVVELIVCCRHGCLPVAALLQLTIAGQCKHPPTTVL